MRARVRVCLYVCDCACAGACAGACLASYRTAEIVSPISDEVSEMAWQSEASGSEKSC